MLEEPSRPTCCIFLGVLWAGGPLGSFTTALTLPQPTYVVSGLSGVNPPIPGLCHTGIGGFTPDGPDTTYVG